MSRLLIAVVMALVACAAWAQKIAIDEQRTAPVAHRYLHGILGDETTSIRTRSVTS